MSGCADCDGGWRYVPSTYAAALYPLPAGATAEQTAAVQQKRRLAENSVRPCESCRPNDHRRWAEGHLASDHDRANCSECPKPGKAGPKARRRGRHDEPNLTPRLDAMAGEHAERERRDLA